MLIEFKTKQDINGNTYYLIIDTDKKTFTINYPRIVPSENCIEIKKRDRNKLIDQLKNNGYTAKIEF